MTHIFLTSPVLIGHMPSAKDRCPKCGAYMTCMPSEHRLVFTCPDEQCAYSVIETSAGMRADWILARRHQ